jgi:hypothetical protein
VSDKVFPLRGGVLMSDDRERLSDNTEEQDSTLTKVAGLAPLFELAIRVLELLLKILRIIN